MAVDLSRLFENSDDILNLTAGNIVFEQGSQGENMYVLLNGELDVLVDGQSIDTIEPGGMIGEMALIDDGIRSATVITAKDSRLAKVSKRCFMFLIQETPFFALQVMHTMADRLRHLHESSK